MKSKKGSFEKSLERLEEIVRNLETGEANLEDSLKLYEEGVRLTQFCSQKLEEVKKKIEVLSKDSQGKLSPRPFES